MNTSNREQYENVSAMSRRNHITRLFSQMFLIIISLPFESEIILLHKSLSQSLCSPYGNILLYDNVYHSYAADVFDERKCYLTVEIVTHSLRMRYSATQINKNENKTSLMVVVMVVVCGWVGWVFMIRSL